MDWSRRVQNFVICLEMLFFAIAHVFVFPTEEWKPGYRPKERIKTKLGENIGIHDFVKDVKHMVKTRKRGVETVLSLASANQRKPFQPRKRRRPFMTMVLEMHVVMAMMVTTL